MRKFLTLCDSGYKLKGMAMHKSLCDTMSNDDWILYWLCIDSKIFNELLELRLKNVILFDLETLEDLHKSEFEIARNNPATTWGGQRSNFIWTLCPWMIDYILKSMRDDEILLYIDADIYFYESPEIVLTTMGDKSFALHTHRFTEGFNPNLITGYFNIGVVGIRHDPYGLEIAAKWKNWMLYPDNQYAAQYGRCGDQGWATLLYQQYIDQTCVFDWEWPKDRVHGSPWCANDIEGKKMVFWHFSHMTITETGWRDNTHGEWNPSKDPKVLPYYEDYYKTLMSLK